MNVQVDSPTVRFISENETNTHESGSMVSWAKVNVKENNNIEERKYLMTD